MVSPRSAGRLARGPLTCSCPIWVAGRAVEDLVQNRRVPGHRVFPPGPAPGVALEHCRGPVWPAGAPGRRLAGVHAPGGPRSICLGICILGVLVLECTGEVQWSQASGAPKQQPRRCRAAEETRGPQSERARTGGASKGARRGQRISTHVSAERLRLRSGGLEVLLQSITVSPVFF
jgi:hypothetical protein